MRINKLFGRTCLNKLYDMFNIKKQPKFKNKENYFITKIAWKNHKYFLSKRKKRVLAVNYIELIYLNNMTFDNECNELIQLKKSLLNNIKTIFPFNKCQLFLNVH